MIKFSKTSTNGKSNEEMRVCQRRALPQKINGKQRYPSKIWTFGKGQLPEKAYYVTGDIFTPNPPTYTDICKAEEERHFDSFKNEKYVNPWLAGRSKVDWHKAKMRGKAKDKLRERRIQRFDPQIGVELATLRSSISNLAGFAHIDYTDELMSHVEGIFALVFTLQGCRDWFSMSTALFLYFRKFSDKSLTGQAMSYLKELFDSRCEPVVKDMEAQADDSSQLDTTDVVKSESWIDMMKNLRDNWAVVKDNKLFSHFSKLLGLLVTLELCKASDLTFSIKEYKVWEPDMKIIHGSAIDIFDAAFNTIVFFVESLSLCWEQKSFKPLIMNDQAAVELDEEFANIVSWWDLVKNGNLMRVAGVSEHEFDARLETLTSKIRNLLAGLKSFDKKLMNDKFLKLIKIKNDLVTMKIGSGIRKAPYCIELFGDSSQGKSTFGEQVVTALLVSAGLPTSSEYRASYNASDKFMSTWSTKKCVLLIDDMANDKSNFVERPPTRVIIDVANNTPFYANVAEIEGKGKIYVEPAICLVTTNVQDLDARVYSNCPFSIQRRMHIVITVKAKEQFQFIVDGQPQGIDPTKVAAYNKQHPDAKFDDIWELTLSKAIKPEKLTEVAKYAPITWKGKKMENVSFAEATKFLVEDFNSHLEAQEDILNRMRKKDKFVQCPHPGCYHIKGLCDDHDGLECLPTVQDFENQFGEKIVSSLYSAGDIIKQRFHRDFFGFENVVEGAATVAILKSAKHFAKHWDWVTCIPTPWMKNNTFRNLVMLANREQIRDIYIRKTCLLWGSIAGTLLYFRKQPHFVKGAMASVLGSCGLTIQAHMVGFAKEHFNRSLVDRNTISVTMKEYRDKHVENICKACAIVGALYGISKVYRAWKDFNPQGSLTPTTPEQVKERDAEMSPWTHVVQRPLPLTKKSATTKPGDLYSHVDNCLTHIRTDVGGKTHTVNGIFLRPNVLAIPNHFLGEKSMEVTFFKKDPTTSSGSFTTTISRSQSVLLPGTDIVLVYVDKGGSFRNVIEYLPDGELSEVEFDLMWRNIDGELLEGRGLAQPEVCSNTIATFEGLRYKTLNTNTFRGMCGAPLIAKRRAVLLGMHLGGVTGSPKGCAGVMQFSAVVNAILKLKKIDGVLLTGSGNKFDEQVLGITLITGNEPHKKSPVNFMPHGSQIAFYGNCPGRTVFKSDVKVTPISEHVTDVMGAPNIYHGPIEEPQWEGWQTCLANMSLPASPYDPDLLIAAIKDYKEDMLPIFRKTPLWGEIRPLNDDENLNGIPGRRFIEAINLSTSIGYPLSGPKRNFIRTEPDVEKIDDPDMGDKREFNDTIRAEIERCLNLYKKGERAYVVARACKKDEVLSKRKCRIFYGNGIALTFLVRKYFLPILRVMQFNPTVSECAVGINSHGPEWQELHEFITKFGMDRLIGGDYGKYDQKLPAQLILAALRIMIDFARECGYSEEDLGIMEAMCGDIVYALIAFNGDLIGLTEGTHISGNSLTVIINGICGSLNMRCFFYSQNPFKNFEDRKKFRDYVSLVTYGDDNIGSVSPEINNFTIKGVSEYLANFGQVYTMPDKESELLDFLPPEEFEFLKRKSVYHSALGVHVGALSEKSCFKMLHAFLRNKKSPLTEEHACGLNIDTALREWFNHGPEVYEKRRLQLVEVAKRADISHLCKDLNVTYEERVDEWMKKYRVDEYLRQDARDHDMDLLWSNGKDP